MSFQDVIKKSVLESGAYLQAIQPEIIIRTAGYVLISLLAGFLLYFIYKKTYTGVVFSHSFAVSLIGMTVLTCAIIVTIQANVVLSLGMVGALSIVRYRTAIKDPMDLMYLFWAVAMGISAGAGMFYITFMTIVVMLIIMLLTKRRHGRDEIYILLIHYTGEDISDDIRRVLGGQPYQIKSKTMRKQNVEMAVEVRVKKHNTRFTEKIQAMAGVEDVTLVQYDGDYIG
ncbi:MAG: DUF4956 domain-containing protein [Clostridia bacterium]